MYDLQRSHFTTVLDKPVATGVEITEEGCVLVGELQNGVEVVKCSTGLTTEVFVGFSMGNTADFATMPIIERVVVPRVAPYLIELEHVHINAVLKNGSYPQVYIYDVTGGYAIVAEDVFTARPREAELDYFRGLLTFLAAEAGHTVTVNYRYDLTVTESKTLFYERTLNRTTEQLEAVAVGGGYGEMFTTEYDTSVNWSTPGVIPGIGAGGLITDSNVGGTPIIGRIIQVPSPDDAYLGVAFSTIAR